MDCPWNSPGRILEWVAVPFSRGSSQPRDQIQVSYIAGRFFTSWSTGRGGGGGGGGKRIRQSLGLVDASYHIYKTNFSKKLLRLGWINHKVLMYRIGQIRSVAQSCPTPWDPMNRSTPGLPVHHQLPELTETHVHRVSDVIQPSHLLSSPSPPAPNPSQHQSLLIPCDKP